MFSFYSKSVFDEANAVWKTLGQAENKNTIISAREYISKSMVLADAHITISYYLAYNDTIDTSINNCMSALYICNQCMRLATDKNKKDSGNLPGKSSLVVFAFKESQWKIAQKIAECYAHLTELYITKGSHLEAKYFVGERLSLGRKVNSNSLIYTSLLYSSNYNICKGDIAAASSDLDGALNQQPKKLDCTLDSIKIQMVSAKLAIARGRYDDTMVIYDKVQDILHQITDAQYVNSVEIFVTLVEKEAQPLTAREVKFEADIQCKKLNLFLMSITLTLQHLVPKDYECYPLQQIDSLTIIEKGIRL
ncbi:hypothetical protein BDB01DRAFT_719189 [Pilobolus umbonatus]|nr:hypothetical protein BDB01DRAFT_719189 [Pilobolus umbonatus]